MSATQFFPALDDATEAALRASIERFGVIVPVVVDQHGQLLDGHHRARIAGELGVQFETSTYIVADDEEAHEVARTLNSDRRHLTVEQRREVVLALRQDGHSFRAISKALKVSPMTAQRDVSEGVTDVTPERIEGQDGKSYPAKRAEPELYYGKGDKYAESITPVTRYFQAWRKRDFQFSHLNPREAGKRLRQLDQLAADIEAARQDLMQRAGTARMRDHKYQRPEKWDLIAKISKAPEWAAFGVVLCSKRIATSGDPLYYCLDAERPGLVELVDRLMGGEA